MAREEGDAISVTQGADIMIDHCSASWSIDETLSVSQNWREGLRRLDRVTVQWSIIAESLNNSAHEKGAHVRYWIAYEFKNPVLQAAI